MHLFDGFFYTALLVAFSNCSVIGVHTIELHSCSAPFSFTSGLLSFHLALFLGETNMKAKPKTELNGAALVKNGTV